MGRGGGHHGYFHHNMGRHRGPGSLFLPTSLRKCASLTWPHWKRKDGCPVKKKGRKRNSYAYYFSLEIVYSYLNALYDFCQVLAMLLESGESVLMNGLVNTVIHKNSYQYNYNNVFLTSLHRDMMRQRPPTWAMRMWNASPNATIRTEKMAKTLSNVLSISRNITM